MQNKEERIDFLEIVIDIFSKHNISTSKENIEQVAWFIWDIDDFYKDIYENFSDAIPELTLEICEELSDKSCLANYCSI